MPRKEKRFHLLYKTTNVITNQYYVGIHSTDNPFDGYLGSGLRLRRSVKKYGEDAHQVEFLDIFTNRKDLIEAEKAMVNREFLADPLCMNLNIGGVVKPLSVGITEETRRKMSEAHKGRKVTWGDKISEGRKGIKFSDEHRQNISKVQKGRKLSEEHKGKIGVGCKGKPATNKRPIVVEGVEYPDQYTASRITGIKVTTIGKRILSKSEKFKDTYYVDAPKQ